MNIIWKIALSLLMVGLLATAIYNAFFPLDKENKDSEDNQRPGIK